MTTRDICFMWIGFAILLIGMTMINYELQKKTVTQINTNHAEVITEIKQLDKIKRDFMSSIELAKKNRG